MQMCYDWYENTMIEKLVEQVLENVTRGLYQHLNILSRKVKHENTADIISKILF